MNKVKSTAKSIIVGTLITATAFAQNVLPYPETPFKGKIGRTAKESIPDFPSGITPPKGAPNVLLIMTDDVGFGASSPFGGPIPTPTLERLARNGLRYDEFHTCAICSPTRAALLTGRNHHSVGQGVLSDTPAGYPGYNGHWPKSAGTIAEVLKENGFNTAMFGKHHNVPPPNLSQAGPFDLWPVGLGFEYFYGFIGADTNQWHSSLYENTRPIEAPEQLGNHPMHLDQLLANKAIGWIRMQHAVAPNKPWFVYYAPGTAHAPHHAPKEWIAKFKGKFDQGWDKVREETFARQKKMGIIPANAELTPRPGQIPAWDSLSADQKRLYARMMEVYAAALAHADYQIGRIIDSVADHGELNNTLIIFLQGDNGASAEGTLQGNSNELGHANSAPESLSFLLSIMDDLGGPMTYNHYPVGWAHAMDTPFQWTKQIASHFGGTRNGLVISWPRGIKENGKIRSQFHHVIDIEPTIAEAVGISFPLVLNGVKQKPIEGVSMVYTFKDPKAPSRRTIQYFEMLANRAIYHDGWMASTTPLRLPWTFGTAPDPDDFPWELYHISEDFTQAHDLAKKYPEKLKELQAIFDQEARKYNVYPLDASFGARVDPSAIKSPLVQGGRSFTYYPGMIRIPELATPNSKNKSYEISAEVKIPLGGASGVLATTGGRFGGWALLLLDGKPTFAYAASNQPQHKYVVRANEPLAPGRHTIHFDFAYDGGGMGKGGLGTLFVDDAKVAEGRFERTVTAIFSLTESFDIGEDTGTPVIEDYADRMPFKFTGKLDKVVIELKSTVDKKMAERTEQQRKLTELAAQ